jgi:hypothetical protein
MLKGSKGKGPQLARLTKDTTPDSLRNLVKDVLQLPVDDEVTLFVDGFGMGVQEVLRECHDYINGGDLPCSATEQDNGNVVVPLAVEQRGAASRLSLSQSNPSTEVLSCRSEGKRSGNKTERKVSQTNLMMNEVRPPAVSGPGQC